MIRQYKLMAEYGCNPIWRDDWQPDTDFDGPHVDDLHSLDLCPQTIERLTSWAAAFDASLEWADPGGPSRWTDDQWLDFYRSGAALAAHVQCEAKGRFEIRYFHTQELAELETTIAKP